MSRNTNSKGSLSEKEDRRHLFEQVLRCLDREENLIHYRLTWGLQWTCAFIAAYVLLQTTEKFGNFKPVLSIIISSIGILVSSCSIIGVRAAHNQSTFLIRTLSEKLTNNGEWHNTEFIRPYGELDTVHQTARIVSNIIPAVPILIWFILIAYNIRTY